MAALALLAFYLGVITVAESFRHALDQLRADAVFVFLVAAGFGVQVAIYLYVRGIIRSVPAGHRLLTGAGTGTSVAGMVACCAHHLADLAPLVGLTGAATLLAQYRLAFVLLGLGANAVGIAFGIRTLYRVKSHQMIAAAFR